LSIADLGRRSLILKAFSTVSMSRMLVMLSSLDVDFDLAYLTRFGTTSRLDSITKHSAHADSRESFQNHFLRPRSGKLTNVGELGDPHSGTN